VLISHADIAHIGALPYACAKLGLTAPIYATLPAIKLGEMFLYDLLVSQEEVRDDIRMTLDDVDATMDKVIGVRYSQQIVHSCAARALPTLESHLPCVCPRPGWLDQVYPACLESKLDAGRGCDDG
jgi:hypothetical protein